MSFARITNEDSIQLKNQWKQLFPDADILPVIGYPSNNKGVCTITHGFDFLVKNQNGEPHLVKMPKPTLNGISSFSPLTNNALFSTELNQGKYINLYEVMLPEIPGKDGNPSNTQIYIQLLNKFGIHTSAIHFHWQGASMNMGETSMQAIHSQTTDHATPYHFVQSQIQALKAYFNQTLKYMSMPNLNSHQ